MVNYQHEKSSDAAGLNPAVEKSPRKHTEGQPGFILTITAYNAVNSNDAFDELLVNEKTSLQRHLVYFNNNHMLYFKLQRHCNSL